MRLLLGRRPNPYKDLEKMLGYSFRKRALLETALTHRSYRFENHGVTTDNQRMEFLGDAVLGLLTAAYFYDRFHDLDEGCMTSFRSQITSGQALGEVAHGIRLGDFLRIGRGEEKSGGRKRASSLADALEAVIGAAFLDGDTKAVKKVFEKLFVPMIETLSGDVWSGNPKGKLQEYSQRYWKSSPLYQVISRDGPAHAATFTVEVRLRDGTHGTGKGRNKQEAESRAASALLDKLGVRI